MYFNMLLSMEENETVSAMKKVLTKRELQSLMWSIPGLGEWFEAGISMSTLLLDEVNRNSGMVQVKDLILNRKVKGYSIPKGLITVENKDEQELKYKMSEEAEELYSWINVPKATSKPIVIDRVQIQYMNNGVVEYTSGRSYCDPIKISDIADIRDEALHALCDVVEKEIKEDNNGGIYENKSK